MHAEDVHYYLLGKGQKLEMMSIRDRLLAGIKKGEVVLILMQRKIA